MEGMIMGLTEVDCAAWRSRQMWAAAPKTNVGVGRWRAERRKAAFPPKALHPLPPGIVTTAARHATLCLITYTHMHPPHKVQHPHNSPLPPHIRTSPTHHRLLGSMKTTYRWKGSLCPV